MPKAYRFRYEKQPDDISINTGKSNNSKNVTVTQGLWKDKGDKAAAFACLQWLSLWQGAFGSFA